MGCCGKRNKKVKSKSDVTNSYKIEKKKNLINDKEKKSLPIEKTNSHQSEKLIEQNQLSKTEADLPTTKVSTSSKGPLISTSDSDFDQFIKNISSKDNISSIKTLDDLQTAIEQNKRPVSIVVFYGRYCPYSKRAMPDLRKWAQVNKDRIFLYEADVEKASKLAEYYHIRTIPTIMAFENNNLIAPIWQRTADKVLSSSSDENEEEERVGKINLQSKKSWDKLKSIDSILDSSIQKSNKQDQYSTNLEQIPNEEEDQNSIDQSKSSQSLQISDHSPYQWDQSILSQKSSKDLTSEYHGRMISESTISTNDPLKKKRTWSEYIDDDKEEEATEYPQHIHLPNCNELFYGKQYENYSQSNSVSSSSTDRVSTLTYQHVKNRNNLFKEELCILYLGPNRYRGFENNLPDKLTNSSKLSLLTLKSDLLSE